MRASVLADTVQRITCGTPFTRFLYFAFFVMIRCGAVAAARVVCSHCAPAVSANVNTTHCRIGSNTNLWFHVLDFIQILIYVLFAFFFFRTDKDIYESTGCKKKKKSIIEDTWIEWGKQVVLIALIFVYTSASCFNRSDLNPDFRSI